MRRAPRCPRRPAHAPARERAAEARRRKRERASEPRRQTRVVTALHDGALEEEGALVFLVMIAEQVLSPECELILRAFECEPEIGALPRVHEALAASGV